MVLDADKVGSFQTSRNDSRITPVGRVLRRTSLDELPQLINVLVGDMSLVGPRPDVPAEHCNYTEPEWLLRHRVRPGITGLAQVVKRSEATLEERKKLDIAYATAPSLWRDIVILWKTVLMVLGRRGVN